MIASKQIAFGRGGKRKPYDAEIEYLESTGTQYIDTGASPVGADIEISFAFTGLGYNNLGNIFGAMEGDNAEDGVFLRSYRSLTDLTGLYGSKGIFIGRYVAGLPTIDITEGQKCTLSIKKVESIIINGTLYRSDLADAAPTTLNSVYLFAAHTDAGLFRHGVGRVYGYKATYADKSIDLIPVRKGNIGYMYDRVSGQLFGNQGTGEFVLGPDIIDYTAKDYIQDGLVAMWDGIENAGWGTHSDSIVKWKDNVSNQGATIPTDSDVYTWESDGLKRVGTKGMIFSTSDIKQTNNSDAYTLEFVFWAPNAIRGNSSKGFLVSSNNQVRLTFQTNDTLNIIIDSAMYPSTGLTAPILQPHHYAWVKTSIPNGAKHNAAVYVDGISKGSGVAAGTSFTSGGITVFRANNDWESETTMKMYALRLYTRALTAEEIAHNYSIDKARFGL